MLYRDDAHNVIIVSFLIAEVSMVSSLIKSLPLIVVIMTAGESSVSLTIQIFEQKMIELFTLIN